MPLWIVMWYALLARVVGSELLEYDVWWTTPVKPVLVW